MSGNLRYTKQLISELECYAFRSGAVLHTKHQYTLLYNVYQRREALVTAHGC
jgi:hypothetical protein